MANKHFIRVNEFCEKYGASNTHLYVVISSGELPKSAYVKDKKFLYIDENYFLRRLYFSKKVWLEAHDYYFYLIDEYKPNQIAKALHNFYPEVSASSWSTFLSKGLFVLRTESIMRYKVPMHIWKFWKFGRSVFNDVARLKGIPTNKRSVSKVLDYRMI